MAEKIFCYTPHQDHVEVYDPERALETATNITFSTRWPKGYDIATFQVKRDRPYSEWAIRPNYTIIIRENGDDIYDGRIDEIQPQADGTVTIKCVGWCSRLAEREIIARWIDHVQPDQFKLPDVGISSKIHNYVTKKQDDVFEVWMGFGDISRTGDVDYYEEKYQMPRFWTANGTIQGKTRRFTGNIFVRTGEAISHRIHNDDTDSYEYTGNYNSGVDPDIIDPGVTDSWDVTFATPTGSIGQQVWIEETDLYDQNDRMIWSDMIIYAAYQTGHSAYSSPAYTTGELVEDILLMIGDELSSDYSGIQDPGQILNPYTVEVKTAALAVIEDLAKRSDSQYRTWGALVWGRQNVSDDRPKFYFEPQADLDDYEYTVNDNESTVQLNLTRPSFNVENHITVKYTDETGRTIHRDGIDNAGFYDSDSITDEYQRDKTVSIGKGNSTRADEVGLRRLEYHKDRPYQGAITITDTIRTKDGHRQAANRVRAGERVYIENLDITLLIAQTNYTADTRQLTITFGQQTDNIELLLASYARQDKAASEIEKT